MLPGRLPLGAGDNLSMVQTSQHLLVCLGIRYRAALSSSKNQHPEGQQGCSEAECLHLHAGRRGCALHRDRSSSRHARGSGGSVPTVYRWLGRSGLSDCGRQSSPLLCSENATTVNGEGHRWPPTAKGLRKQLFAHTNVQQPKKYLFSHAIICWCLHVHLS